MIVYLSLLLCAAGFWGVLLRSVLRAVWPSDTDDASRVLEEAYSAGREDAIREMSHGQLPDSEIPF